MRGKVKQTLPAFCIDSNPDEMHLTREDKIEKGVHVIYIETQEAIEE